MSMEHNVCKTCGAGDGRAGLLINNECMNCHGTRKSGDVRIDAGLRRTDAELRKTIDIIEDNHER